MLQRKPVNPLESYKLQAPPAYKSAIRTTRYVSRYIYQILKGCGDPTCTQTYCKGNVKKVFKGKRIRSSAAVNLAMQVSSLRGDKDLCEVLKKDILPPSISKLINEAEPLKSPILTAKETSPAKVTSINDGSTRAEAAMWANVKSVLPASKYGNAFLSLNGDSLTKEQQKSIRNVFEIIASTNWEDQQCKTRSHSEYEGMLNEFSLAYRSLTPDQKLYLYRYVVNSINGLQAAIESKSSDELSLQMLGGILYMIASNSKRSSWSYLNFRITQIFSPYHDFPKNKDIQLYYEMVAASNMLRAWCPGLNTAPAALQPHIFVLLKANRKQMVDMFPEIENSFMLPKAKLPPISSSYILPHLLQPMYEPTWTQKYMFLTDHANSCLLPFQERVDLLRYICLKRMSNATQQSIACRALSSSMTRIFYPTRLFMTLVERLSKNPDSFTILVSRDSMIKDAIKVLVHTVFDWDSSHRALKIQLGKSELAVDQGGVQVEFFNELGAELVKTSSGYFTYEEESKLAFFSPGCSKSPVEFEYIGMLCGIAVHNGCTISVEFPLVMYKMIRYMALKGDSVPLGHNITPNFFTPEDLAELFPSIARSFQFMLDNPSKLVDLNMPYQLNYQGADGTTKTYPLFSKDTTVTAENVTSFIIHYTFARLYASIAPFFLRFYQGFTHFVPPGAIVMFSAEELRNVVEGTQEINVLELKAHTTYDGFVYNAADDDYDCGHDDHHSESTHRHKKKPKTSPTVEYFWNIVETFNQKELADLLEFVTGTNRVASGGMGKMEFIIQKNGSDEERIPSSSVCFSRLLLPEYSSQDQLEKMLRLALKHSVGFGLV